MQKIILALVAGLIVAGGGFMLLRNDPNQTSSNPQGAVEEKNNPKKSTDPSTQNNSSPTITYSNSGFSPQTITVNNGDTLTVKNNSSRTIQFESDPHPAHTTNTELNIDTIRAGQSKIFTVKRTGTFGYHDHLSPSDTGTIVVQ